MVPPLISRNTAGSWLQFNQEVSKAKKQMLVKACLCWSLMLTQVIRCSSNGFNYTAHLMTTSGCHEERSFLHARNDLCVYVCLRQREVVTKPQHSVAFVVSEPGLYLAANVSTTLRKFYHFCPQLHFFNVTAFTLWTAPFLQQTVCHTASRKSV